MILEKMGVYGWSEHDENLLLASILTGDPILLIGNRGCAKTHVAYMFGEALDFNFLCYDASKAMFDDVLGYPNVEKLKEGKIEYVPSPVTIWDKEMILIDELNRALPELQSKWLEIIRSRKIMGFPTKVKWVWSAMNPVSYSATQTLDEALIGRFSLFLFPPDILNMEETDRKKIVTNVNHDDAPALNEWKDNANENLISIDKDELKKLGIIMKMLFKESAEFFEKFNSHFETLPEFLSRFAILLSDETDGEIQLDGRRVGFINRNILAYRSIEFAKNKLFKVKVKPFKDICSYVINRSIPYGINDPEENNERFFHKVNTCFDILSSYFDNTSDLENINKIYELLTTSDLVRKIEILFKEDNISEMLNYKVWNDMINKNENIDHILYTALILETLKPNTVPNELLNSISSSISPNMNIRINGQIVKHLDILSDIITEEETLEKMILRYYINTIDRNKLGIREEVLRLKDSIISDKNRLESLVGDSL